MEYEWEEKWSKIKEWNRKNESGNKAVKKGESMHVISIRRTAILHGSRLISYDAFVFPYRMRLVSRFFHSFANSMNVRSLSLFLSYSLSLPLLLSLRLSAIFGYFTVSLLPLFEIWLHNIVYAIHIRAFPP